MRYNTPNNPLDSLRDFVTRGGMPVTLLILAANVVTFLAAFFASSRTIPFLETQMVFSSANFLHAPWTVLTYPLVSERFSLWLIVIWVFFWLSGGSLERGWGSQRFAVFFFAVTVISALSMFLGGVLLHSGVPPLNDLFLPLTGLIVAFCMLNPEQTMVLYFFPVKAKYVAIIATVWTYLTYGSMLGPALGLFSLGGILAAYLYVRFARPWADIGSNSSFGSTRRQVRGPDLRVYPPASRFSTGAKTTLDGSPQRSPFDMMGRWKDYQERRRLEKLWKNSGFNEPEQKWRDDEGRRR